VFVVVFMVVLLSIFSCFAGLEVLASGLQLETTPKSLLPFEAEAEVQPTPPTLTIKTGEKTNANLHLEIKLPPETPWLSTDFPIVEGKTLVEIDTPLDKTGSWSFRPMLPIRGDYTMPVEIQIGHAPVAIDTFTLHVGENPAKIWNFVIVAAVLFNLGVIGGSIIGGKQHINPGQLAPSRVVLFLSALSLVAIIAMIALAIGAEVNSHRHHEESKISMPADMSLSQNSKFILSLTGAKESAVGSLAYFKVEVKEAKNQVPAKNVAVIIRATQLEDNFPTLSFTGLTNEYGEIAWKEMFFDGAPHKIEAVLEVPEQTSLKSWQTISVEAIHPPVLRRLITLAYMTLFLVIGLLIGFGVRKPVLVE